MENIKQGRVRRRAEHLYEHLDLLKLLRQQVRRELLVESRKQTITAKLRGLRVWDRFAGPCWWL